jgi:hypothetical protein
MPRAKIHQNDAERSRAYRQRAMSARKRDATFRENLGGIMERIEFVHDTASAIAKDNIKNWKAPALGWELRSHKLQQDIDDIVEQLDALARGDSFEDSPEFQSWRAKRDGDGDGDGRTAEATG